MKLLRALVCLFLFSGLFSAYSQSAPLYGSAQTIKNKGNLVIVGGGLEADNKSLYNQLVSMAGGPEKASFAVIPSASGVAVQSYMSFRNILISYGVKPENIHLINIAVVDDDSTHDINESTWKDNGNDTRLAYIVRSCSAVWFTGGDQLRSTKALFKADGSRTPVLDAVWEVYQSGGVIGGTSAGAAIMSEAMIGGGNSLSALEHGVITDYQGDDFPEDNGVLLSKGFGFFPAGIVDQHFDTRARIARLAVVLMKEKPRFVLGFGIDENTALVYNGSMNLVTVAGTSGITIINCSQATLTRVNELAGIRNLNISYLQEGDSFDISSGTILPAPGKKPTKGNEHNNIIKPGQPGVLSGHSLNFHDLLTHQLIDNKGADTVTNVNLIDRNSGFLVTLYKTPSSEGFLIAPSEGESRFTVVNVQMDITPVILTLTPLKQ